MFSWETDSLTDVFVGSPQELRDRQVLVKDTTTEGQVSGEKRGSSQNQTVKSEQ